MNLNSLAIKHNTDKADFCHNYCPIYQSLFDGIKDTTKHLLEIGISEGASVRMWADYFKNANIYGIDIEYFNQNHKGKLDQRIKTFIAHQENEDEMLKVVSEIDAPIDIIIDDGSHDPQHIKDSLRILYPFLKQGGLYLIEDVEFVQQFKEDLKDYNYWFATAKSEIGNSNIIVIKKNA